MKALQERIREYRTQMHLSQEYVADHLGISRAAVTQIELGKRRVSAEELAGFSQLFGVSADTLLHGETLAGPSALFARSFENLNENDQAEIMNLIKFKEMMKAQRIR